MYIAAPTVKYYFGSTRIKPYLKAAYGFGRLNVKREGYAGDPDSYYGYSPYRYGYTHESESAISEKRKIDFFEIAGGVAFFLSNRLSIDLSISYEKINSSDWIMYLGYSSSVGINFFLGKSYKNNVVIENESVN